MERIVEGEAANPPETPPLIIPPYAFREERAEAYFAQGRYSGAVR